MQNYLKGCLENIIVCTNLNKNTKQMTILCLKFLRNSLKLEQKFDKNKFDIVNKIITF